MSTCRPASTVEMQIAVEADSGLLDIGGSADCADATLVIALLGGYTPALGNMFGIIDYGSLTAQFGTTTGTAIPGGLGGLSRTTTPTI